MILSMLDRDPSQRLSADAYLQKYRGTVFPACFYDTLYDYCIGLVDPSGILSAKQPNDACSLYGSRIDDIYRDIMPPNNNDISNLMHTPHEYNGIDSYSVPLFTTLDEFYNKNPAAKNWYLRLYNTMHEKKGFEDKEQGSTPAPSPSVIEDISSIETDENHLYGAAVLLPIVLSTIRHVNTRESKINALSLVQILSRNICDESKLDTVLPFVMTLLRDQYADVRISALITITRLVSNVTSIAPINAFLFQEYLFPDLQHFLFDMNSRTRATYASCLPILAKQASKFLNLAQSLRNAGILSFPESEYENINHGKAELLFETGRHDLVVTVERHVSTLLADSSSIVRRSLLNALAPLCVFFGKAKSNDLILSHLITYLNDTDWMLRCAFFESITGLSIFIGPRSVDEYILPLMLQALVDPEPAVLESVLGSFSGLIELHLFEKLVVVDILQLVLPLVAVPNAYIRRAALSVIYSAYQSFDDIDRDCIVTPLLRPYLMSNLCDINSLEKLDQFILPMVSDSVWSTLTRWYEESENSSFWKCDKDASYSSLDVSNDSLLGRTKNLQKREIMHHAEVYTHKKISLTGHVIITSTEMLELSEDDQKWADIIKEMGVDVKHLWVLANLRDYVKKTKINLNGINYKRQSGLRELNTYPNAPLHILPETIFWNPERPPSSSIANETFLDRNSYAESIQTSRSYNDDLIARDPIAYVGTDMTNAFGTTTKPKDVSQSDIKVDINRESNSDNGETITGTHDVYRQTDNPEIKLPSDTASSKVDTHNPTVTQPTDDTGGLNSYNTENPLLTNNTLEPSSVEARVSSKDSDKHAKESKGKSLAPLISSRVSTNDTTNVAGIRSQRSFTTHIDLKKLTTRQNGAKKSSYTGTNPCVLNYLNKIYAEAAASTLNVGAAVSPSWASNIPLRRRTKVSAKAANKIVQTHEWHPEGSRVAQIYLGSLLDGGTKKVLVSPDSAFFVTLGSDGVIRAWQLVESVRHISTMRCECRLSYGHTRRNGERNRFSVVNGCFLGNTYAFASVTQDGSVEVHRLDVNNQRHTLISAGRIPNLDFSDSVTSMEASTFHDGSIRLVVVTKWSRIVYLDVGMMRVLSSDQLPLQCGSATSVVVSEGCNWALIGTTKGWLLLWDLRFGTLSCSWHMPARIDQMHLLLDVTKKRSNVNEYTSGNNNSPVTKVPGSSSTSSSSTQPINSTIPINPLENHGMLNSFGSTTVSISFSVLTNLDNKELNLEDAVPASHRSASGIVNFDVEKGKTEEVFLENWNSSLTSPIPVSVGIDAFNEKQKFDIDSGNDMGLRDLNTKFDSPWPCISSPIYRYRGPSAGSVEREPLFLIAASGSPHAFIWNPHNVSASSSVTNDSESSKLSLIHNKPPIYQKVSEQQNVRPKSSGVSRPLLFLQQQKNLPSENRLHPIVDMAFLYQPYAIVLIVDAFGSLELWT